MDFNGLLECAINNNASDLHLSAGLPPVIRVDGDLKKLNWPVLDQEYMSNFVQGMMNEAQRAIFKRQLQIDFAIQFNDHYRLRSNIFVQARGTSAVFRIIPTSIKTLEELGFPAVSKKIVSCPNGLVLITGASGSGKSTTLAAFIHYMNSHFYQHIITLEDPIEFIYESNKCLIHQREIHRDALHFSAALRSALREDPDIILLGELRDPETIRLAITAAETGHLVFATLHTNSSAKALNRIIDVFPGDEKTVIRTMLSESLQAVITQALLKKTGGGRIAAFEIMLCTPAIRNLIRENKIAQIYSVIQTGQNMGMQTLEQHVRKLVSSQLVPTEIELFY